MNNKQVAAVLYEIADLLEIKGESPFKSRAYSHAARTIESMSQDIQTLVESGVLSEMEGIGESLTAKITTLVQTGSLPYYDELKAALSPGLIALLRVPGLGPKKVKLLYEKLKIEDLEGLEKACREGELPKLPGMGAKTAANILMGIEQLKTYETLYLYDEMLFIGQGLVDQLKTCKEVIRVSIAGSLRRGKDVTKDIDLLVSSSKPEKVADFFCSLHEIGRVVNRGETKVSVILKKGMPCDLRIVEDFQFPYALHHFTGSKEHNVAMRQLAISKGMKMSEWGLFKRVNHENKKQSKHRLNELDEKGVSDEANESGELVPCKDEEAIFHALGMQFVPPELRENLGEIEAAQKHAISKLVEYEEIQGCFHNHTVASDGHDSLTQMAKAAEELGWKYLGISDHSKSSGYANGLSEERLLAQIEEIHAYNAKKPKCIIFSGTECDILKDGTLDFEDPILAKLDFVVASVHSALIQSEEEMTRRILRAIENPYVTMIGHLTGRLLLKRAPSAVNILKIIDAAAETGTWIELNANPWRLDMDWHYWRTARDKGVKCVINPDAHHTDQLQYVKIGVLMARKGWLRSEDIINTHSLAEVKTLLQKKRKKLS